MSRAIVLAAGLAVLVVSFVTVCWFISTPHEARRSQEYIQAQVDKHLPKTAHGITVHDAKVTLENNHVVILAEVTGTRLTKSFSMVVESTGVPDYQNSHKGEFFFRPENVSIYDFHLDEANPRGLLNRIPDRFKGRIEDWMVKHADRGAMLALERVPVYRLKDDNVGWVVRSSLESARVDGNELVITYSLWKLSMTVLFGILMVFGALVFVVAAIACPEALLIFEFF